MPIALNLEGTRCWGFGETVFAMFVAVVTLPLIAIVVIILVLGYPPADVVRAALARGASIDRAAWQELAMASR